MTPALPQLARLTAAYFREAASLLDEIAGEDVALAEPPASPPDGQTAAPVVTPAPEPPAARPSPGFPRAAGQPIALPTKAGDRVVSTTGVTIECVDDRPGVRHPYPLLPPENADGTLVGLHDSDHRRYADHNGHPIVRDVESELWRPILSVNTAYWFWSATDPNAIFAIVKPSGDTAAPPSRLVRVDVERDVAVVLVDFHESGHRGHASLGNGAHGACRNDRYLAVQIAAGRGQGARVTATLLVDLALGEIVDEMPAEVVAGTSRVTSRVSRSGQWLCTTLADGSRHVAEIADGVIGGSREILATGRDGRTRRFPDSHSALLIDATGDDVLASDWGGGQSFMYRLRDGAIGRLPSEGWGHIGVAARDGWCVDYSYGGGGSRGDGAIELVPLVWGAADAVAMPLDTRAPIMARPSTTRDGVRHVAQHGSSTHYSQQPQASQGISGRVYWTCGEGGVVRELCAWAGSA